MCVFMNLKCGAKTHERPGVRTNERAIFQGEVTVAASLTTTPLRKVERR